MFGRFETVTPVWVVYQRADEYDQHDTYCYERHIELMIEKKTGIADTYHS